MIDLRRPNYIDNVCDDRRHDAKKKTEKSAEFRPWETVPERKTFGRCPNSLAIQRRTAYVPNVGNEPNPFSHFDTVPDRRWTHAPRYSIASRGENRFSEI